MGARRNGLALAALALCLGCGASDEDSTGSTDTTSGGSNSTAGSGGSSTGSGGTGADSGGTGADSGGASTSSAGASMDSGGADNAASSTTGSGTGGGQDTWPRTETHACLAYVQSFCEYTSRCSGGQSDVDACFEATAVRCPDLLFAPGSTRTVESTFACAKEWLALSCEITTPECATSGTLADGDPCVSGIQCASRLCSGTTDSCGSCMPSADLDEACNDASGPQCKPGLHCDPTNAVCVASTTSPNDPLELGEECDPSSGSGCYPNDCRADDAGVYRCQPYPTLGQDCSDPLTCAFGNSYCDITQVCLEFPAAGEPCGVDGFTGMGQWCGDGLFCDRAQEPPVCAARPGPGEACDGACQEGLSCNCTDEACGSRLCQRLRIHGESCSAPTDGCILGACEAGTCVVPDRDSVFDEVCGE